MHDYRLTRDQVLDIRHRFQVLGEPVCLIAERYQLSLAAARQIGRGRDRGAAIAGASGD
jgi:hypothetical protein